MFDGMVWMMMTHKHMSHLLRRDALVGQRRHNQRAIRHHPWISHDDGLLASDEDDRARNMPCPIRRDAGDQLPSFDGFDVPFDEYRDGIHNGVLLSGQRRPSQPVEATPEPLPASFPP